MISDQYNTPADEPLWPVLLLLAALALAVWLW